MECSYRVSELPPFLQRDNGYTAPLQPQINMEIRVPSNWASSVRFTDFPLLPNCYFILFHKAEIFGDPHQRRHRFRTRQWTISGRNVPSVYPVTQPALAAFVITNSAQCALTTPKFNSADRSP